MKSQTGFRFRCYPTRAQAEILMRWIGCQRAIYNAKVSEDRYYRKFARSALGLPEKYPPIDQEYSRFVDPELTPWLKEVPSQILRNGAVRWKQAYARFFQKVGGRPVIKKKTGRQAVWITSELFTFAPYSASPFGPVPGYQLAVGTKKFPVGNLLFTAHRNYQQPKSIRIGIESGQWYISFSNESEQVPDEADTLAWLQQFSEEDLLKNTFGGDRGCANALVGNHGERFHLLPQQEARIERKRQKTHRYQRQMARQRAQALKEHRPVGQNYRKTRQKAARAQAYGRNVREDFAHKTSRVIVNNPQVRLIVLEDLNIKGMTKKPKAKKDENGKWLKNHARAKAGLSKSILSSAWRRMDTFLHYKAIQSGKLFIKINPYQTSQECFLCGHIHPDNRISQSEFVCQACGNIDHADHNAAKVIAHRGVRKLLAGEITFNARKQCGIHRQKPVAVIGPERSESTPGESQISHVAGNGHMQETENQELFFVRRETPATTASAA
jgi:putative transposase